MENPEMLTHVRLFWVCLMWGAGKHMARTGRDWGLAAWYTGAQFVGNRGILECQELETRFA